MIPLAKPTVGDEEIAAVAEVLRSGWLAHGPKVKEFEAAFAAAIGTRYATSTNSCASALQLSILGLGLKGEIIVPSFTFAASANAIVQAGCVPVFADILNDTCTLDPESFRKALTKKTVGVMPVHFAGQSCAMDTLMEIADANNLAVIEDSAEAIGAEYCGKKTGSFGIGCFSFYPTKNITTGEGGMVTTNDEKLALKMAALKAHGMTTTAYERERKEKPWLRAAEYAGFNFRMCDINAAIGLVQLRKLDGMNEKRRSHAAYLTKRLADVAGVVTPTEDPKGKHVYQMYTIRVPAAKRSAFIAFLKERGIAASVHYDPPVHLQPYYHQHVPTRPLPVTEQVAASIVTLPFYPQLTRQELDDITGAVAAFRW